MKLNILPIFIAAALGTARAADIKTLDGKQYKNVTVSRVEPDGIVITASYGIIKLPFEELPKDIQAKYGFDASRAAKFRQQVNAAADAANGKPLLHRRKWLMS